MSITIGRGSVAGAANTKTPPCVRICHIENVAIFTNRQAAIGGFASPDITDFDVSSPMQNPEMVSANAWPVAAPVVQHEGALGYATMLEEPSDAVGFHIGSGSIFAAADAHASITVFGNGSFPKPAFACLIDFAPEQFRIDMHDDIIQEMARNI